MGYAFAHLPHAEVVCRLDEHGGEKEERHTRLCEQLDRELIEAIRVIAAKPEYAEIIGWADYPEG